LGITLKQGEASSMGLREANDANHASGRSFSKVRFDGMGCICVGEDTDTTNYYIDYQYLQYACDISGIAPLTSQSDVDVLDQTVAHVKVECKHVTREHEHIKWRGTRARAETRLLECETTTKCFYATIMRT
jgi:hypothetical protein